MRKLGAWAGDGNYYDNYYDSWTANITCGIGTRCSICKSTEMKLYELHSGALRTGSYRTSARPVSNREFYYRVGIARRSRAFPLKTT